MMLKPISQEAAFPHLEILSQLALRAAGSPEERAAAIYVQEQLRAFGISDVREQTFTTAGGAGWKLLPHVGVAAVGLLLGQSRWRLAHVLGGALTLAGLLGLRHVQLGRPTPATWIAPQQKSQNIVARIPAAETPRRLLFFVSPLSTDKPRPESTLPLGYYASSAVFGLGVLGGALLLLNGMFKRRFTRDVQNLAAFAMLGGVVKTALEEVQPNSIPDASPTVLLTLGEQLALNPLRHTEVTLIFTGASDALNDGIEAYLRQYAPPREHSVFVALNHLGSSKLGYVSRAGVNAFNSYRPTGKLTALSARLMRQHPELRVMRLTPSRLDETANVLQRGYEGIALAGATIAEDDSFPDQEALARAVQYSLLLAHALDDAIGE